MRWAADSVQAVMRGYRADMVARRESNRPLGSVCEGIEEYFTTRNAWGKSLAAQNGRIADLIRPKCGLGVEQYRTVFDALRKQEGPETHRSSAMSALLDSLLQLSTRTEAAGRSVPEVVSMLVAGIDRIETLAAASMTDQEFEQITTMTAGLTGAIAEAQAALPAIIQDVSNAVDNCVQRLGHVPANPADCDQDVFRMFGRASLRLPQPVLMCVIATKATKLPAPASACDGHQIIEGIANGFIGGLAAGFWGGLVGTGGLGVPLTTLLGGIGGAFSGLVVGLGKTIWCEINQ
jgi:hypothetical protein